MRRTSHIDIAAFSEFALHTTTGQVGVVIAKKAAGTEGHRTIRLADGQLLTAPAGEFRSDTEAEVQSRHRVAAAIRPLALPSLPTIPSRAGSRLHGG